MKKYIYMAVIALAALTTSCSDFLEQDNKSDKPSDAFYATKSGFNSLMNSTYSSLRSVYGGVPWVFSAGTDLYAKGKQGVDAVGLYGSTYNSSDNDVKTFYTECFQGIQLANSILYYSATTEASGVREQYVDEARFIRAYYYYLLVQQFGGVTLNKEMFNEAVMSHARNSAEEVYQFVIDEFTELSGANSKLLERSAASGSNFGRANKRAASHFLAKAYLARGYETFANAKDFENAAICAEQAINGELPTLPFSDVFDINKEENNEVFWAVQYSSATLEDLSKSGNAQQSLFGVYLGGAEEKNKYNYGFLAPTFRLHELFTEGDSRYEGTFMLELYKGYYDFYDAAKKATSTVRYYYAPKWVDVDAWRNEDGFQEARKNTIVVVTQAVGPDRSGSGKISTYYEKCSDDYGVPCIRKFDDPKSPFSLTGSTHDIILARLGETYLVAAEAYIQMSQPAKAKEKIDALRKRAAKTGYNLSVPESALTGEAGIDFILDERARECAGEYHRWMDLKRTGRLIEYVANGTYNGKTCRGYNPDGIKVSDFMGNDGQNKILRPIPLDAINKNKGEVTQNPGF